ncbi:MAG: ATP-binding protein [Bacteroidetes bacterium]|nr:ATP-binding protein [Bacteroidota bacterium]
MYIKRDIHEEIKKHLGRKEFTIITGPRQSGKTSLIRALFAELEEAEQLVQYVTFEDRDILSAINTHPEEIFTFIRRPGQISGPSKRSGPVSYLFIDEVQYADDPSNFLKYLFDSYEPRLKIIATGSSAFYIDSKFKDSLAGRKRVFELGTLSFAEYLRFNGQEMLEGELAIIRSEIGYRSIQSRALLELFDEFLVFGGYPEVVLESDLNEKILLLKEIRDSFLKRDVDESGISSHDKFYTLLSLMADQVGNLVNRNELANTIGVDHKTIDKYISVLRKCFHIELVRPFHSNRRKELTKMPKVYFKDHGLRNVALNRFYNFNTRQDQEALVENYTYKRLSGKYDPDIIRFWRFDDRKEIDFVLLSSFNEGLAYEVKLKCAGKRIKAMQSFNELYPAFPTQLISYDFSDDCTWILNL